MKARFLVLVSFVLLICGCSVNYYSGSEIAGCPAWTGFSGMCEMRVAYINPDSMIVKVGTWDMIRLTLDIPVVVAKGSLTGYSLSYVGGNSIGELEEIPAFTEVILRGRQIGLSTKDELDEPGVKFLDSTGQHRTASISVVYIKR